MLRDMKTKEINEYAQSTFGVNLWENDPTRIPRDEEELYAINI